jgi:signal peptidase
VLLRLAHGTAGLASGLAVLLVLGYTGLVLAGYRPVAVYSGSMVPTLGVGSLAVVEPVASQHVRVGDVITFRDPYAPDKLVTHRLVRRVVRDGVAGYRTKGDANPVQDPWTIRLPPRVGRLRFSVPLAGYALVYAGTREVRQALILLVGALFLCSLLRRIWRGAPAAETA